MFHTVKSTVRTVTTKSRIWREIITDTLQKKDEAIHAMYDVQTSMDNYLSKLLGELPYTVSFQPDGFVLVEMENNIMTNSQLVDFSERFYIELVVVSTSTMHNYITNEIKKKERYLFKFNTGDNE